MATIAQGSSAEFSTFAFGDAPTERELNSPGYAASVSGELLYSYGEVTQPSPREEMLTTLPTRLQCRGSR